MKTVLNRRLAMLTFVLIAIGILLFVRLFSFQFNSDLATYFEDQSSQSYRQQRNLIPDRGRILDRNGNLLATNEMNYKIGISPNFLTDKAKTAHALAAVLNMDEQTIFNKINNDLQYVQLTSAPVPNDVAQKAAKVNPLAIVLDPVPHRIYPQGGLAAQVVGFVGGDGDSVRGYVGVEGDYNSELAGRTRSAPFSAIPFEISSSDQPPPGHDIMLTIDRSIQYLAETELQDAITKYGAVSGNIIIMNPRNGEVLAMASYPSFDPNSYYKYNASEMHNPAVSDTYEPGSVFKIVTGSVALQSGKVTPDWTYYDNSPYIVGGRAIYNWDRAGHGSQNFVDVLVHSWNIGTSHLSVEAMGEKIFYKGLQDFGVGSRMGIDLEGEAPGVLRTPVDTYWSDSDLATNSFGQGLTVTPLQMISFGNAIANDGTMMQPHVRLATINGGQITPAIASPGRAPISPAVAHTMRDIMVQVVSRPDGEGHKAFVPGYTVAGKTGTAQIACATCANGFDPTLVYATFFGFLPADEPRVSVLIKLDKVENFASQTAAPSFAQLVKRLVVIMNIPTDVQRQDLHAQGGNTALIVGR